MIAGAAGERVRPTSAARVATRRCGIPFDEHEQVASSVIQRGYAPLAALLIASCASAPDPLPSVPTVNVSYALIQGRDTVSVETVTRTDSVVEGTVTTNRVLRTRYRLRLDAEERVASGSWEFTTAGVPPTRFNYAGAETPQDTVRLIRSSADVPFLPSQIVGLLEQIARRAEAGAEAHTRVPVFVFTRGGTRQADVWRHGADSVTIQIDGIRAELELSDRNRVVRGWFPDHGVRIERIDTAPVITLEDVNDAPPGANYRAEDIAFVGVNGDTVGGTLTLPLGAARAPAVVLITGSGKNNRNQGSPPSVPFRQIADTLSRRGIAVLRLDDIGVGASQGNWENSTLQDEAANIRNALDFLRARADIDAARLGLVGWSEGGAIAPLVAADDSAVHALVLIGAPGGPLRDVLEYQTRYRLERDVLAAHQLAMPQRIEISTSSRTTESRARPASDRLRHQHRTRM